MPAIRSEEMMKTRTTLALLSFLPASLPFAVKPRSREAVLPGGIQPEDGGINVRIRDEANRQAYGKTLPAGETHQVNLAPRPEAPPTIPE